MKSSLVDKVDHLGAAGVAVAADQDSGGRPVGPDGAQKTTEKSADLRAFGPFGRVQHGGHDAALTIEHHDRLEAILIVISIEQPQLPAAIQSVKVKKSSRLRG